MLSKRSGCISTCQPRSRSKGYHARYGAAPTMTRRSSLKTDGKRGLLFFPPRDQVGHHTRRIKVHTESG